MNLIQNLYVALEVFIIQILITLKIFKYYGEMIGIIKIPSDTLIVKIEDFQGVKYKSPRIDIIDIMNYTDFIFNNDIYQEEKMKCTEPILNLRMAKEQTLRFVSKLLNKMDGL